MTRKHFDILFIDTSVLIAAVLGQFGASRYIFRLAEKGLIKIILTEKVLKEAKRNLLAKYNQERLEEMITLLAGHKESIMPDAIERKELEFLDLINDPDDIHILTGAKNYKVDYLITLDRKHFFTKKLKQAHLSFKIMLPGEFLKFLRSKFERT